jgi:HEAT repeat protein
MRKYLNLRANIAQGLLFAFLVNTMGPLPAAQADDFFLPKPGMMVSLSPEFDPPILKGIKVHPHHPFRFDFILDQGDNDSVIASAAKQSFIKEESIRLIKYFLASLTIPEKDLWVNLSPYEKKRIIPQSFGLTEMGRDLLAEDYMLKQITASLMYPESETGRKFWKRIYEEAARKFGTTDIPVSTFNKVWIVPEKAVVFENAKAGTAYIVESRLKVMLEQDYLAIENDLSSPKVFVGDLKDVNSLGSQITREIVIPELTKEINENKNFAQLRQVYNSLILATWYKKKIRDSILAQVYEDRKKIEGVKYEKSVILSEGRVDQHSQSFAKDLSKINSIRASSAPPQNDVERIYQSYLQAFKKGAYNYIKEERDPLTRQIIPRKYFSGGLTLNMSMLSTTRDPSMVPFFSRPKSRLISVVLTAGIPLGPLVRQAQAQANAQQVSVRQKTEAIFKEIAQKHKDHDYSITFVEEDTARAIGKGAVDILLDKLEKARQQKDKDEMASAILLLGVLHDEKALDRLMQIYDQYQDDKDISLDVLAAMTYFDRQANRKNNFAVPKQLIRFYLKTSQQQKTYRTLGRFDDLRATESGNLHDGEKMEAILKWALDDDDPEVRAGAIRYAIWAKPYRENANMPKFRDFLLNFRDKENSSIVMANIMRELGFSFIKNADTKEYLKQVFKNGSNDEQLRLAALNSLVEYEGPDIEEMFKGLSSGADTKFRGVAMEWLGRIHGNDKEAIDKLIHQFQTDENADVRQKVFSTLEGVDTGDVFSFFMDQARHGTTENRVSALSWLDAHHQKDPQVKDLLIAALHQEEDPDMRKEASELLVSSDDPEILNTLINQYVFGTNPISKETENALNTLFLRKVDEFQQANDEGKRSLFDFFEKTLRDNRFPKSIYYNIGSDLIDIADDVSNPRPDRDKALGILKSAYRLRMTAIASQLPYSSNLTQVVNHAINALDEKPTDDLKLRIQEKYGRPPQGMLFYLTIPDVVLPFLEARQKLGKIPDLDIFTAGAFAEGYILIAKGIVKQGVYTERLGVVDTLGFDSFPMQEERLKRNGMLPKNYDGFVRDGFYFKDIPSLLEAFWASWVQERGYYRSVLKARYRINPDSLSREETEVGTYAAFVSKDFDQMLKLNGPLFLGKVKKLPKQDRQHGVVVYNAQWPAATAEWLRGIKIFDVDRAMATSSIDPRILEIQARGEDSNRES